MIKSWNFIYRFCIIYCERRQRQRWDDIQVGTLLRAEIFRILVGEFVGYSECTVIIGRCRRFYV